MASSYRKIQDYDYALWGIGSPVVVERMRLCFDKTYGVNVLQITFRNVTKLKMYGLSISLTLKREDGKEVHAPIDFNYYAMEIAPGKTFGGNEDIVVEPDAMLFDVTITGADLAGGIRAFEKVLLERMPVGRSIDTLGELEEPFLKKFRELYPKIKPVVVPADRTEYWRCSCDRIWPYEIDRCTACKTDKLELLEILPTVKAEERRRKEEEVRLAKEEAERRLEEAKLAEEERLRQEEEKRREREQKEREEEERRQAEERRRQEEEAAKKAKQKKILLITVPIILTLVLLALLASWMKKKNQEQELVASESSVEMTTEAEKESEPETEPEETETVPVEEIVEEKPGPLLIIGEEINESEDKTIWRLFGRREDTLEDCEKIRIPDAWGHTYMDSFVGKDNVENAAKSGILIIPTETGGININMYNITFFTEDDYRAVIEEIGYENAQVIVASPEASSGSTAMLGLYVRLARMTSNTGEAIGTATARGNINIRTGPGVENPILSTVKKGTELEVIEITENGWLKIAWPGAEEGYAFTSNSTGNYYQFN